jgi:hypothetical protein
MHGQYNVKLTTLRSLFTPDTNKIAETKRFPSATKGYDRFIPGDRVIYSTVNYKLYSLLFRTHILCTMKRVKRNTSTDVILSAARQWKHSLDISVSAWEKRLILAVPGDLVITEWLLIRQRSYYWHPQTPTPSLILLWLVRPRFTSSQKWPQCRVNQLIHVTQLEGFVISWTRTVTWFHTGSKRSKLMWYGGL